MNRDVTRRALLRSPAAAGAFTAACHPLPALAGDPDAEILALWARRCDLNAQALQNSAEILARGKAGLQRSISEEDEINEPIYEEMSELEKAIFAIPAAGLTGLLVKLRIAVSYDCGRDNMPPPTDTLAACYAHPCDHLTDLVLLSAWADAERLIGGAA